MFPESFAIFRNQWERFNWFESKKLVFKPYLTCLGESFACVWERFGERFKNCKYMKNNIFIKKYINLSPIPTPPLARRAMRARVYRAGELVKIQQIAASMIFYPHYCYDCHMQYFSVEKDLRPCTRCGSNNVTNCNREKKIGMLPV